MKWGDGEELVITSRSWTTLGWIVAILLLIGVVITSLNTPEPCEGLKGQERTNCVDLNYP
jgi:hypothetical protein